MTARYVRLAHASTPVRMPAGRGKLLWSCAALAITAAAGKAEEARAQAAPPGAFRGTIDGTPAGVSRGSLTATTETITISAPKATIDWLASQADFLPAGNVATFLGSGVSDFTVLNRISADGQQIQLNGTVLGRLQGQANTPAGKIWFYSPGGIVVGATAVFDVGGLLLTANNPLDFEESADGFGRFHSDLESNASVTISPGTKIDAMSENSYVALIASRVEQHGTVNVNGSVAYAAGQQMTMTLNQGLFDISIDVGTDDPNGVVHTGTTEGPASNGATDKHAIFVTAVPKNFAIQMLLQGNWGYATATSASIENGAIYLSAGVKDLDVFADNSIGSRIKDYRPATGLDASILFQPGQVTSKLEGQATTNFELSTVEGSTATLSEDVSLYGGERAEVLANDAGLIDLKKNLLLFSYGNGTPGVTRMAAFGTGELKVGLTATLQSGTPFSRAFPSEWSFVSGESLVEASGGTIRLGALSMRASVLGDTDSAVEGGVASVSAVDGGEVHVTGNASLSTTVSSFAGNPAQGGTSALSIDGGTVTVGGNLDLLASGSNAGTNPSGGSPASGGTAQIWIGGAGGTLDVTGTARLSAVGTGGAGQLGTGGAGGSGTGGAALVTVSAPDPEMTTLVKFGSLNMSANASGGAGDDGDGAGVGGTANGGVARVEVSGGSLDVVGATLITANATGGNGQTGGNAYGGSAGVEGYDGTTDLGTDITFQALGVGGHATIGNGGNGGIGMGGVAYIQANANLGNGQLPARAATITGGTTTLTVSAIGGDGGAGNGDNIAAGVGGAGHGGLYTGREGSGGAFVLADASGGTMDLGNVLMNANGFGGKGGAGGTEQAGGTGGEAFGGMTQAGTFDVHQADLRNALFTVDNLTMHANATGGAGGTGPAGQGNGGAAIAGGSITDGEWFYGGTVINAQGTVEVINLTMNAIATGGAGATGGAALGGGGWLETYDEGGELKATGNVSMNTSGTGGAGAIGAGGAGTGGQGDALAQAGSIFDVDGLLTLTSIGTGGAGITAGGFGRGGASHLQVATGGMATLADFEINADGFGGHATNGAGGNAKAGTASIEVSGTLTATGETFVSADGEGGDGTTAGGSGDGGDATIAVFSGGSVDLGALTTVRAEGDGGSATAGGVGAGIGANATVNVADGSLEAGTLVVDADGETTGGTAAIDVGDSFIEGSSVGDLDTEALVASANGGVGAGEVLLNIASGSIANIGAAELSALGANSEDGGISIFVGSGSSFVEAAGGLFADSVNLNSSGSIYIEIANDAAFEIDGAFAATSGDAIEIVDAAVEGPGDLSVGGTLSLTAGTTVTADDLSAGGDLLLDADGNISVGDLSAAGEVNLTSNGNLSFANVTAAELEFDANGTVTGDNIIAGTRVDGDADGALQLGNITVGPGLPEEGDFSVGLTSATSITVGNVSGADKVGFATPGSLTTGNLTAGSLVMTLVGGNISTGAITTDADGQVYMADSSMFAIGGGGDGEGEGEGGDGDEDDFDENIVLAMAPIATGGLIEIEGPVTTGTLQAAAGTDLSIGDVTASASAELFAGNTANFLGDVSAPEITVTSRDINIAESGSIGVGGVTQLLTLNAVSDGPVIIGDDGAFASAQAEDGLEYRLDEDGDIESDTVVINALAIGEGSAPDVHLYDVEIDGSLDDDGGVSHVVLNTGGSVLVRGLVLFGQAAATDVLEINAGQSIQVNTSEGGRIAMVDGTEEPSGILELTANDIWVGDQALLDALAEDANFAGRDAALATNNGEAVPEGHVIAGEMSLAMGSTLFVQNSGTETQFAGITVSAGGLSLQPTGETPATVVAYGQQFNGDGTFTGGDELVELIDFGSEQSVGYTAVSTFNGCSLNDGCAPLLGPELPFSGPESILGPVGLMDSPLDLGGIGGGVMDPDSDEDSEEESAASVAAALGLISTGGLTTQQLIDDPVTSGSDSGQWGDLDGNPGE